MISTPPTLSELNVSMGYVCGRAVVESGGRGGLWVGMVGCVSLDEAGAADVRPEVVVCWMGGAVVDPGGFGRVDTGHEGHDGAGAEGRGGDVETHRLKAHSVRWRYRCCRARYRYHMMHRGTGADVTTLMSAEAGNGTIVLVAGPDIIWS